MTRAVNRYGIEREQMIAYVKSRGITDADVLRAMRTVDRHAFVRDLFRHRAYEDSALPIECNQTISQPFTVAFMTQALRVAAGMRVLEIGTGSGYQAALLAEMGAHVFTIERYFDLLQTARKRFDALKYKIASKVGDGSIGWSEFAPYDRIIVTAGAPEVPRSLMLQLKDGGILVIPVGDESSQSLCIVTRRGDEYSMEEVQGFRFVPLVGKEGWKNK